MNQFELPVLFWIRDNLTCPFLDTVMPVLSSMARHGEIWILLAVVLLCIPKTRRVGLTVGLALAMGYLVGNIALKNLVARVRPYDVAGVEILVNRLSDFSFPSGHTLCSFEAAVAVWLYHRKWGAVALVFATVMAFSRLYLFVHYPTDVLAGAVLGVGIALLAYWLVGKLYDRKKPSPLA